MADVLERPSDVKMAARLLLALIVITATIIGLFWLFGDGTSGPAWTGVGVGWGMGFWYWFRNRQMRNEDQKARCREQF